MRTIVVETTTANQLIDVTERVQEALRSENAETGLCLAYVPHTTAGLTINENADPNVRMDLLNALNRLIPESWHYAHSEGNSPAHVKASLVGHSVAIMVEREKLVLGTWQGIFLCEFDGPRRRSILVKFLRDR